MDAKMELTERLCRMFPEDVGRILETLAEYEVIRTNDGKRQTLAGQIGAYLAAKRVDGLSPKTLKNYRDMLGLFAARTGADKLVAAVTTDDLRGHLCYLADVRKLKPGSIQTHINTLRSFFAWLVDTAI